MNRFTNRLSALMTATLIGSAALAQAEMRKADVQMPNLLELAITQTATSVAIGFEGPQNGLLALGASLSPMTGILREDLPPVLVDFAVLQFQLCSGYTELELPRWIATYYAQCGVLDLDDGVIKISEVVMVETAADTKQSPADAAPADEPKAPADEPADGSAPPADDGSQ